MSTFAEFDHYDLPLGPDGTPYEFYEALRDEAVKTEKYVQWSEAYGGFWVIAGWNESRAIQLNNTTFSNVAVTFPAYATPGGKPFMLSGMDEPEHKHYRAMVQGPFTSESAERMDAQIRAICNALIDTIIESGRADVCDVTTYLPEQATAAVLGLPLSDAPKYRSFVEAIVQGATDPEGAAPKIVEMEKYWADTVAEKRVNPTPGLLSEIINSEYDGKRLNGGELLDFFTVLILGGLDNTARFLGNVFYRLAWDKELRRRLAKHPEQVPLAVEEFLRLDGPACVFRLVEEDIEVGGVQITKGQIVGLISTISNRDPRQFTNPDTFVIDRSPNRHTSLGSGIHRCLGLNLVRVEVRAMIQEFLRRVPEFDLDLERPTVWVSGQVSAMHHVPIVFPAGKKEVGVEVTADQKADERLVGVT